MSEMPIFGNDMTTLTKVVHAFTFTKVTPVNIAIRRVFIACSSSALTPTMISRLSIALAPEQSFLIDEIQDGLTQLTRQGVLRSRQIAGIGRVYEVNY